MIATTAILSSVKRVILKSAKFAWLIHSAIIAVNFHRAQILILIDLIIIAHLLVCLVIAPLLHSMISKMQTTIAFLLQILSPLSTIIKASLAELLLFYHKTRHQSVKGTKRGDRQKVENSTYTITTDNALKANTLATECYFSQWRHNYNYSLADAGAITVWLGTCFGVFLAAWPSENFLRDATATDGSKVSLWRTKMPSLLTERETHLFEKRRWASRREPTCSSDS